MAENPLYYQNDFWTLQDDLGIGGAGDVLAKVALQVPPPFAVRVTGKWGAGKTSVLRRAFATLGGKPISQALPLGPDHHEASQENWNDYAYNAKASIAKRLAWSDSLKNIAGASLCIWYSPWQHQQASNPLIPLILEIKAQYSAWFKIKETAEDVNRRGGLVGLTLLEKALDGAISLFRGKNVNVASGTTKAVRETWESAAPNLTSLSDGQRFHLLFEDAVKNALAGLPGLTGLTEAELGQARMIIFVDDLDRCEESTVVSLLESIKLYLSCRNCVFVFGLDDTAVLGALKRHWCERSDNDNREYLEKLFQMTLNVPQPKPVAIKKLLNKQLTSAGFTSSELIAGMIEELLEPNPRKIKNFANSLCASWQLFSKRADGEMIEVRFTLVMYLRLFHSPVWRVLERQPKALGLLGEVLKRGPGNTKLKDVIDLEAQRISTHIFARAFAHVLHNTGETEDDKSLHRAMSLEEAVKRGLENLDQKRSDEYFVAKFREYFKEEVELDSAYLHL